MCDVFTIRFTINVVLFGSVFSGENVVADNRIKAVTIAVTVLAIQCCVHVPPGNECCFAGKLVNLNDFTYCPLSQAFVVRLKAGRHMP
jgi:hypothetical protein